MNVDAVWPWALWRYTQYHRFDESIEADLSVRCSLRLGPNISHHPSELPQPIKRPRSLNRLNVSQNMCLHWSSSWTPLKTEQRATEVFWATAQLSSASFQTHIPDEGPRHGSSPQREQESGLERNGFRMFRAHDSHRLALCSSSRSLLSMSVLMFNPRVSVWCIAVARGSA
ncbi:hypothetical protein DNTS_004610 [Danionella cerebrum]|uniref:Uncharacterized protein n=1 Tax=Danionella cerebrum TaxID=2873325 RepID=A0A553Q408_9TELE|nr:hypothetical protein DNTS_004610 [Danionella translucida]